MNKHILLVKKWLKSKESVTHEELKRSVRVAADYVYVNADTNAIMRGF